VDCVLSGVTIGAGLGSISAKLPIVSSKSRYQNQKQKLRGYSIKK